MVLDPIDTVNNGFKVVSYNLHEDHQQDRMDKNVDDCDTTRTDRTASARTASSHSVMKLLASRAQSEKLNSSSDKRFHHEPIKKDVSEGRNFVGSTVYYDDIKNCISHPSAFKSSSVSVDSEKEEIEEYISNELRGKTRSSRKERVKSKNKSKSKTKAKSTLKARPSSHGKKKATKSFINIDSIKDLKNSKGDTEETIQREFDLRQYKKRKETRDPAIANTKQNHFPAENVPIETVVTVEGIPPNDNSSKDSTTTTEKTRSRSLKSVPMTTQSIRRSTCYFSALQEYGFIERATLKAERIEAFFFNNGMTITLSILYFALNAIVAAHAAYQFTPMGGFTTTDDVLRVTLPIARAGGRLVTLNCALLLLTACKYLWTLIRSYVVPIIPIGFPIDDIMPRYHRAIALFIIVSGCIIHSLPQIVNYATGAIWVLTNEEGKIFYTFGEGLATTQLLVTGTMLIVIFITFFVTTLKAFRQTAAGFRWFWFFHIGGIALVYPLLIVHGTYKGSPIFLYSAMMPLILYLFDAIMRRSKVTSANVLEWKTHPGDGGHPVTELILECPPNFVHTPGQYVELKFESISSTEWHPFTIASAPGNDIRVYNGEPTKVLIFFVLAKGRWTKALFNFASAFKLNKAIERPKISIRGPHGAPVMNFFEYKHIIVVGSGVGVTPLLSVWQYLVEQGRSRIQDIYEEPVDHIISNDVACDDDRLKIGSVCSRIETVLESLTASIALLCIFVVGETIVSVTFIFQYFEIAYWMGTVLASISLFFHNGTIAVSILANGGGRKYFRLFKCWVEVCIIVVDAVSLWLSISGLFGRINGSEVRGKERVEYQVGLGGITVFFHAIRMFHVFYRTLKPKTEKKEVQNRICSVQGIFINRKFAAMRFCFEQLLLRPVEEGLSKAFSLRFYGTQEERTRESLKVLKRGIKSSMKNLDATRHSIKISLENPINNEDSLDEFDASMHSRRSMMLGGPIRQSIRNFDSLSRSIRSVRTMFDGSLETLDKNNEGASSHARGGNPRNYFCFNEGRPDFQSVFRKSILKAHFSCPEGETVGVFFCGSPAIAKHLVETAAKVTADHRYSMKKVRGKSCNCKIVVHVENY